MLPSSTDLLRNRLQQLHKRVGGQHWFPQVPLAILLALVTALYYAMVTMNTVGYGDIAPQTSEAKLFTVSVIVLGVAVFATSLTAVIAPLATNSFQRIVNRKGNRMKRENHFVVIGDTPLALNTSRELARRGLPVTRMMKRVFQTTAGGGAPDTTPAV